MSDPRNGDRLRLVVRYAKETVEIIRLKLRIIGFSNKLTGLFARLGEATLASVEKGRPLEENETAQRLMNDIRDAQREIKEAEEGIEAIRAARIVSLADGAAQKEE